MNIQENVSLKPYNTFGVDAKAKRYINVESIDTLQSVLSQNKDNSLFILGGGSNMLLTRDIDALVIHLNLKGISIVKEQDNTIIIEAKAGENWHDFVQYCIKNNYGGIENLSLIPGNVGTAPIQNIGAYGVELKDVFHSCTAVNIETQELKNFNKSDCKFGYRESVFKQELKGKFIITSVCFQLTVNEHKLNTSYGAISSQLEDFGIDKPTICDISWDQR